MKKTIILVMMLISMVALTACVNANADTPDSSAADKTTIELELDKDYDDTDPFVNAKLFCVSEDLDALNAEGTFKMDGESVILEVKNNRTGEVLWSKTWEGAVKSETFSISLENLTKEDEYAVYITGRKINSAAAEITFDSDLVQERERPLHGHSESTEETVWYKNLPTASTAEELFGTHRFSTEGELPEIPEGAEIVFEKLIASKPSVSIPFNGRSEYVEIIAKIDDSTYADVTSVAEWKSTDDKVAIAYDGRIMAMAQGTSTITASFGGKDVSIEVVVEDYVDLEAEIDRLNGNAP